MMIPFDDNSLHPSPENHQPNQQARFSNQTQYFREAKCTTLHHGETMGNPIRPMHWIGLDWIAFTEEKRRGSETIFPTE